MASPCGRRRGIILRWKSNLSPRVTNLLKTRALRTKSQMLRQAHRISCFHLQNDDGGCGNDCPLTRLSCKIMWVLRSVEPQVQRLITISMSPCGKFRHQPRGGSGDADIYVSQDKTDYDQLSMPPISKWQQWAVISPHLRRVVGTWWFKAIAIIPNAQWQPATTSMAAKLYRYELFLTNGVPVTNLSEQRELKPCKNRRPSE